VLPANFVLIYDIWCLLDAVLSITGEPPLLKVLGNFYSLVRGRSPVEIREDEFWFMRISLEPRLMLVVESWCLWNWKCSLLMGSGRNLAEFIGLLSNGCSELCLPTVKSESDC